MFKKKKEHAPKNKGGGKALMQQLGLDGDASGGLEADVDLEAELAALMCSPSDQPPTRAAQKAKKASHSPAAAIAELDQMVASCMRDDGDSEDDGEVDLDDADLLAELADLTSCDAPDVDEPPPKRSAAAGNSSGVVSLIEDRLSMYRAAYATATVSKDTSKAKRLTRGVKSLEDMLKKARAGKPIDEDEIPPPVAMVASSNKPTPQPSTNAEVNRAQSVSPVAAEKPDPAPRAKTPTVVQPKFGIRVLPPDKPVPAERATMKGTPFIEPPSPSLSASDEQKRTLLISRKNGYKMAALRAKKAGDNSTAIKYIGIAKQFDKVIAALEGGQPVDLTQMPPPVSNAPTTAVSSPKRQEQSMQGASSAELQRADNAPGTTAEDRQRLYAAPEVASSTLEALQQRLGKYREAMEEAKESGNGSKARRVARIVKQYEDALKAMKSGRSFDYTELPNPPGFPPIPPPTGASPPQQVAAPASSKPPVVAVTPVQDNAMRKSLSPQATKTAQPRPGTGGSQAARQAKFLLARQLQFKRAALQAKETGDVQLAKKYLRLAKGFDQMIVASESGLPVDMSQLPSLPTDSAEEFVIVPADGAADQDQPAGDRIEMYKKLQQQLLEQLKMSTSNAERFTQLGDVSTAAKFDVMRASTSKDIDAVKNAFKHDDPVPRFHYEMRNLSVVKCCSHLGDDELELCIKRGVSYALPSGYSSSDLHTYVKYDFPFPTDNGQKGCTEVLKATNSPEHNQTFKLDISRKSRTFLRLLKSKSIKFEIYYRRGFLKSDKLLATLACKLQPLEGSCVIHESLDLMEGKKTLGGRLEVMVSVRDPLVSKQVEEMKQKWLVIEHFERRPSPSPQTRRATPSPQTKKVAPSRPQISGEKSPSKPYQSIEVLKYEKLLLDQQIRRYQGKLTAPEEAALQQKSKLLSGSIDGHKEQLKQGGKAALIEYVTSIEKTQNSYVDEAKAMAAQGNREKAQSLMTKKKIAEKEVAAIRSRLKIM